MLNTNLKVLCLSFHTPPALRPQAILIGKMIPEWIKQKVSPAIATYKTEQKWDINAPMHFVELREIKGNIISRNLRQWRYYQKEAKKLAEFAKNLSLPKIKIGLMNDKITTAEEFTTLSLLPSRDILLSTFVFRLKTPLSGFHYALTWNLQKFVTVLNNIKNKKPMSS